MAGGRGGSRSLEPLARSEVVFAGQPVALVIAETEEVAADGAKLLSVDYERWSAGTGCDVEEAIQVAGLAEARLSGRGAPTCRCSTPRWDRGRRRKLRRADVGERRRPACACQRRSRCCLRGLRGGGREGRFPDLGSTETTWSPQAAVAWVDPEGRLVVHASTPGPLYAHVAVSDARAPAESAGGHRDAWWSLRRQDPD